MRRPRPFHPRRAMGVSRRIPATRPGAAVELARIEHERARLEAEITRCCDRAEAAMRTLETVEKRSHALLNRLGEPEAAETLPGARAPRSRAGAIPGGKPR